MELFYFLDMTLIQDLRPPFFYDNASIVKQLRIHSSAPVSTWNFAPYNLDTCASHTKKTMTIYSRSTLSHVACFTQLLC